MYIYNIGNYDTAGQYSMVYHYGVCPKIKEIEYYKDGAAKKVILR